MTIERNWRISDEFIVFIYAAGVHLFLHKAHEGKLFEYRNLSFWFGVGIFFFAQDWISRFSGFKRVQGFTSFTFYIKTMLDLALVITLCVIFLDAIHQIHIPKAFPISGAEKNFYYKIAFFAFVAWFWNFVVIFIVVAADPRISRKNIISFLGTGHVNDQLLVLFPKMNSFFQGIQNWVSDYTIKVESSAKKLQTDKNTFNHLCRTIITFLHHTLWRHFIIGPIKLIPFTLMCWVGLHLLILNLLLSVLIYLSIEFSHGNELMLLAWNNYKNWLYWIIAGLIILVCLSSIFRTYYFSGGKCKRWLEFLGYVIFWLFLLGFYSLFTAQYLAFVLAIQQTLANAFIFAFLLVSTEEESAVEDI
jgi:hypothetical protein